MTKPEPLKKKVQWTTHTVWTANKRDSDICVFRDEDIRSAVEWLKDNIGHAIDESNGNKIYEMIDKAFEDVMKDE
ncbi:hypothetical protein KKC87_04485 [Patescibacteria group bacterium]|nr:hypothetical protein [Patescibacteria group bacterium]